MTVYSTHLTNEEMPEPGTLLRVVSVHPGNRTFETAPVGHEPGWLVADPASTNNAYWTDGEVSEEHPGWVRHQSGVPAAVISRHGPRPDPETPVPSPRPRRRRGLESAAEQVTENTGDAENLEPYEFGQRRLAAKMKGQWDTPEEGSDVT